MFEYGEMVETEAWRRPMENPLPYIVVAFFGFRKRDDDWSDSNVRIVDVQRCRAGEKHDGDYVVQLVI